MNDRRSFSFISISSSNAWYSCIYSLWTALQTLLPQSNSVIFSPENTCGELFCCDSNADLSVIETGITETKGIYYWMKCLASNKTVAPHRCGRETRNLGVKRVEVSSVSPSFWRRPNAWNASCGVFKVTPRARFSKVPKSFRTRKAVRKIRLANSVKLVFSYVVKGIKI